MFGHHFALREEHIGRVQQPERSHISVGKRNTLLQEFKRTKKDHWVFRFQVGLNVVRWASAMVHHLDTCQRQTREMHGLVVDISDVIPESVGKFCGISFVRLNFKRRRG